MLLLDVDGPLNPFAAKATKRPQGYQTHYMRPTGWQNPAVKPLRVWLNPSHGESLMGLGMDIVWATTWEYEANEWIGPHIGLPKLEVLDWTPTGTFQAATDTWKLYWKTPRIVEWALETYPERPFIWVDDECTASDALFIKENIPWNAGVYQVKPNLGLLDPDFRQLREWAKNNA